MTLTVLFAGSASLRDAWSAALEAAAAKSAVSFRLIPDPTEIEDKDAVDVVLFAPSGPEIDLSSYPNLRLIQSLWAGVETIVTRPDLPADVPLARMVESGLTQGMVEYVVGHVMRVHLGIDAAMERRRARDWTEIAPPLASDRRIGVMGLGALGAACADALVGLGFPVAGWSRSAKSRTGVQSFNGPDGFRPFLEQSDILVVLTPLTEETQGLLDAGALALLPADAHVVNVARGPIIDDAALLAAIAKEGGLSGATLDVFDTEPLPLDHPFWDEPRILITPHIASVTRPETASHAVIAQLERLSRGETPMHLVDPAQGY